MHSTRTVIDSNRSPMNSTRTVVDDLTIPTNHTPVSSLLPFPSSALPFHLHCITGIDFTFHPTLWENHTTWVNSIRPLLQLFISSFHLKYIFLFSHQHTHNQYSLASLILLLQPVISSWNISAHIILSHLLGDNISRSRFFLYLSPIKLSSPSLFAPQPIPTFPNPDSWLSSTFNINQFSRFTTTNLINISPIDTPPPLFFHPKFKAFVHQQQDDTPTISNSVVDHLHPVPEPPYLNCSTLFDGWFGIPFKDAHCFTHVRSPHPTKILRLYGLSCF